MSNSRELANIGSGPGLPDGSGAYALPSHDRVNLSESIGFFRRRLHLILAVTGLAVLAGLAVSLLVHRVYTATASVMLTGDGGDAIRPGAAVPAQPEISGELVDTQAEIITSRDMAGRVADALGLDKGLDPAARRKLLDELQHHVSAERSGKSYSLSISYDAHEAQAAADRVNEFARQFSVWQLKSDQTRDVAERKSVEARLARLRAQSEADTRAVQQYRIAHNLLSVSGTSLTEQEISNYDEEVARARAQSAEDQARLQTAVDQLRSGSTGDDVGEALGSPVISQLRLQESQAASEVANLSSKYGPNHPLLIRAQSQLAEVRRQIQAEIGRVISNLRARQEVSSGRLASLDASLGAARGKLSQNNAAMVGLTQLDKAAEASQGIYEAYLNRYKELLAAEGSERPNARILSLAQVPLLPRSPNIPMNLGLSLVIGLGLGVLAAYVAEALFQGISSPEEVEQGLGERFLASIPLLASVSSTQSHPVTAVREEPRSAFTESFRALGVAIEQATQGEAQVIAVTSALPGEGKTIVSSCLAHVLASSGARTILIDCDMRRRGISRLLHVRPDQKGLVEVLNGTAPLNLEQQLAGDHVFCVLPLVPSDDEPEHLLTGPAFVNLLAELRQRFDRIILDLPPVLPIAATRVLASRADAVVLTARWRKTPSLAMRAAISRLPSDRVNLVGVVLSQVDLRRRAYFHRYDPSFYYDSYREYYS